MKQHVAIINDFSQVARTVASVVFDPVRILTVRVGSVHAAFAKRASAPQDGQELLLDFAYGA